MASLRGPTPAASPDDLSQVFGLSMLIFKALIHLSWYAILFQISCAVIVGVAHLILRVCEHLGLVKDGKESTGPLTVCLLLGHSLLVVLPWLLNVYPTMSFQLRLASSILALCVILMSMIAAFIGVVVVGVLLAFAGKLLGVEFCERFIEDGGRKRAETASQVKVTSEEEDKNPAKAVV